jgi:hypothetical protein
LDEHVATLIKQRDVLLMQVAHLRTGRITIRENGRDITAERIDWYQEIVETFTRLIGDDGPARFCAYVGDVPVGLHPSLEEAQRDALARRARGERPRVESLSAPGPSRTWVHEDDARGWVEVGLA